MVNEVHIRKYAELGKAGHMKENNRRKRCVGTKVTLQTLRTRF